MEDRANVLREMKVCRFCLSDKEDQLSNIYEKHVSETKHSIPLPLQIMACISIEVFKNDGMPQLICNSCRNFTQQVYTFKANCKKTDDALKLFLATGQFSKPYLQKLEQIKAHNQSPPKVVVINKRLETVKKVDISTQTSSTSPSPRIRNIKIEEGSGGTEVITVDVTDDLGDDEVQQGQNENESILGMEMEDETPTLEEGEVNARLKIVNLKQYNQEKHQQNHEGGKLFTCDLCQKSFSCNDLLVRHQQTHKEIPAYMCTECEKTFLTKDFLEMHMEKHRRDKPYTCSICMKSFVFKQGLERHAMVHRQNKQFKCNYCEASFNTVIELTRHVTQHSSFRPYPCRLCGRTFLLSHHLSRHMKSHFAGQSDGINQHKCDICSMSFRRKDSLVNHSAIHSMVNLRCVICNTSFESASLVKEHITTHLTGLPHPCEKCDYSFETPDQLEVHQVIHAQMEYEDQIEKEVISEAFSGVSPPPPTSPPAQDTSTSIDDGTEHVADMQVNEPTPDPKPVSDYPRCDFLKNEIEDEIQAIDTTMDIDTMEDENTDPIRPIIRHEGTKVYKRKAPFVRIVPRIISPPSPENSEPIQIDDDTPQIISDVTARIDESEVPPDVKYVKKELAEGSNETTKTVGGKVVKVQKFIISKNEMKAMAKKGILELKNGKVVLKNKGQPIFNASLKPLVEKDEINSLLEKRQQLKQYQKR